jgi:filamentous hemagglutinin family protein
MMYSSRVAKLSVAAAVAAVLRSVGATAATLPVPCTGSACGSSGFVSAGQATATQAGSKLTVNQTSSSATLNWSSFNISADGTVKFVQPTATAVALNMIYDSNPTQIFGALNANGRVFLINQNGIIFGGGAQINVGGLLASTLNIDPAAVSGGLIASGSNGNAAFQPFSSGTSGAVTISNGATLQTGKGGEILVFAPEITNEGIISTPGGQTMLAAGGTIYLASSNDPNLRGLLVQVGGTGGTVTNGTAANASATSTGQLIGQILAADGNVTLAGLAVNQLGRVSATTSINENGTIRLQAGDQGSISASGASGVSGSLQSGVGGTLVLGSHSVTQVTLDTSDPSTTVDSIAQPKSDIEMSGYTIQMLSDALAQSTSGTIEVTAAQTAHENPPSTSDGSRFYMASGAELDVSGAGIVLPVGSNVIPVQLRGTELADSPLQQDGPLRGQTVYVDIRQGTPLADISGEIAAIGHNVVERNLTGGSIAIDSHGDAILAPESTIDVAGGQIRYTAGYLNTSKLITATGQVVDIGSASPDVLYSGIANSVAVSDAKWGVSNSYGVTQSTYSPGYVEGKDAGALTLSAPQFVLDSNVSAGTVQGAYQRRPDQSVPDGELYRPYNQVPAAAALTIGTSSGDFVVGNVTMDSTLVLPELRNGEGRAFNPLTDALPANYTASVLRPDLVGSSAFGNVSIYTNGEFLQPASVLLDMPAGGSFGVHAGVIDIQGSINAPDGVITAAAGPTAETPTSAQWELTLGPHAALSVAGEWINDNPLLNTSGNSAPVFINGGSISLSATASGLQSTPGLRLDPGSLLDVSGGGQVTSSGTLNSGTGGAISIGAIVPSTAVGAAPVPIQLGATLRGYGLGQGGTLALTAGSVCVAAADCASGNPSELWISPAALEGGGFRSYALTADFGGIIVEPDTTIALRQQNLAVPVNYTLLPDQGSLTGHTGLTILPDQLRQPVSLSLSQFVPPTEIQGDGTETLTVTRSTPSLVIGQNALIEADPGAILALNSNVRIIEDGTLQAQAGTISLSLGSTPEEVTYSGTQAIWLGSRSLLDASGAAQLYANGTGSTVGNVLPGGTVSLTASRGYIEMLPGAVINVAGTSAVVDETGAETSVAMPTQVASAGGSVQFTAAEGISLGGALHAAAGVANAGVQQPAGGSLSIALDGSNRNDYDAFSSSASSFPLGAREIDISATQPAIVVDPGTAVPDFLAGHAYVSVSALENAGFDTLNLHAASDPTILQTPAGAITTAVPGIIAFSGNVALSAGRLITLDAASYSVSAGSTARIRSPYIEFGNSDQYYSRVVPTATTGTGTLSLSGQFIELFGTSALEGVRTAVFDSTGDLRVRGVLDLSQQSSTAIIGGLYADGNLQFSAEQMYPSTLSQFIISADAGSVTSPTSGSILIQGSAGAQPDLLSAGGSLTLSAGAITQQGVLRAPFGTIVMDAQSITLGSGSLTSTSADGQTIPFGTTQGGLDWIYPLPDNTSIVYGTDGIVPPAQRIALQAANVAVHSGAVIDVRAGGDLQAYEWIDGTGGTNDVLAQSARPDQYAIVPSLPANIAPYDPNISAGSTLQPGAAVYLSGMPGLPSAVYQLLPARYALLPGAFLVTQVAGYQDLRSGQTVSVPGGGTIIAGYNTVAGTTFSDSRTSGFDVVPASIVIGDASKNIVGQAQYTITNGDQFFSTQATTAGVTAPRLPEDSGVLALVASDSLALNGTLLTAPASNGLGAEVDISSANIVVGSSATTAQPGQIVLTSSSLNALDAQTLLIGGELSNGVVDTSAQSVKFLSGPALTAPTVLVTASDRISLESGASIDVSGVSASSRSYDLQGDGAFLSVSSGAQSTVARSNSTGATGTLLLAPGSSIRATDGSVYLDASNSVTTGGTLSVSGADLAVQSTAIILGTAPAGISGTVLNSAVLGAQGLRTLLLESAQSIQTYGSVSASAKEVTLDAPGVMGFGAPGDVAALSASDQLTLENAQSAAAPAIGTGSGTLQLAAPIVSFAGGAMAVAGYDVVAVDAQANLTASASSSLSASASVDITTSRVALASGVDLALTSTGQLALLAPAKLAGAQSAAGLGAALSVTGSSINVETGLNLPSGQVTLTTTGDAAGGELTIGAGGSIDVAGIVQQYDGVNVATAGGMVSMNSAGNITLASGSVVDVSAGGSGQGGELALNAPTGAVSLQGNLKGSATGATGAAFQLDAQKFESLDALNQRLNAAGFNGARDVRLRGAGDLIVDAASNDSMTASNVSLEADQGRIIINGLIDAAGVQGGTVTLAASGNLVVNGTIDAHASGAGGAGGSVSLQTTGGDLLLTNSSIIDLGGGGAGTGGLGAGGQLWLRAPSATVAAVANGGTGVQIAGTVIGDSRTTLEAFSAYQNTTGVISAEDVASEPSNPIYAAAVSFMSNAPAITGALGQGSNSAFTLVPGVEIDATIQSNATGTLELDTPWNLYGWRFGPNGTTPGVLTLRAQSGLTFNASLSDGFDSTTGSTAFTLPSQGGDSWSYRIVAGADFTAANPLTVNAANPADVTIAACQGACSLSGRNSASYAPNMVRTGDGFIDVGASGDFILGSQQSLLYTAGIAGNGVLLPGRTGSLQGLAYPINGGDIQIQTLGNIQGATTDQFVNAWLWRVGSPTDLPTGSSTAWTVSFRDFQQGVGALAGGNVSISAGGDISNLSASIPTIGVQIGGNTEAQNRVQIQGGGDLEVMAGGSILGGSYFVGRGLANLQAGAEVGAVETSAGGTALAPIIGLGDAALTVTARGDLALAEILNPTLLNKGQYQGAGSATAYFSTYGANSSVTLSSIGGNVVMVDDNTTFESALTNSFLGGLVTDLTGTVAPLDVLPAVVNLYSFSGDVDLSRALALVPSTTGNLQIFANHNFDGTASNSGGSAQLIVSDADPNQMPSAASPQQSVQIFTDIVSALNAPIADQHAAIPVYKTEDEAGTLLPVRIVALNGSVQFQPNSDGIASGIWSAKPVDVVAGLDVADLNLVAQNLGPADVTSVTAGRNISYAQQRLPNGAVAPDANGIAVDGPGRLELTAGGGVNLGTSEGLVTRANLVNPVLPQNGAGIGVLVGIDGGTPQYAPFISKYIQNSDQFDSELIAFVTSVNGSSGLSAAQAKTQFGQLTSKLQDAFVDQVLLDLLRIYGSQEAASGNGDFSGAFAAITTLFPGANPDLAQKQANPYSGNIELYFSRIYSEQGGDISLLAPGGDINVGLALAPASFGINKTPDQLGIVAQTSGNVEAFSYGDFEVNQSRVFAADGGDILVWSTEGNIDAGRGSKTAISAPSLNIVYDSNGDPTVTLRAAIAGSGIQALAGTPGVSPGDVYLFAPHGVVNANDAGIVAGNLTVAATAVLGSSNISVSGTTVGVPVAVTGLGASFSGASSTAGATANTAESFSSENSSQSANSTPASEAAISWLDVFVTGLGEENCKPDDIECLKRASAKPQDAH